MEGDRYHVGGAVVIDPLDEEMHDAGLLAWRQGVPEVGTHYATTLGNRGAQAYIGDLISGEYDLEGTCEQFSDWRDFFVGSGASAETMAAPS